MKVIGHMVMRNEADRYLEHVLRWLVHLVDEVAVYDDQSNDRSVEIADQYGRVTVRPDDVPSFGTHEGQFRQAGWEWMVQACSVVAGDLVLSIDADEFLIARDGSLPRLGGIGSMGLAFPVMEVFGAEGGEAGVRTDGFWGQIQQLRLVPYQTESKFADRADGCGSVPASSLGALWVSSEYVIVHLGYLRSEDRVIKHQRYSNQKGHNPRHVASITQIPKTVPLDLPLPQEVIECL
jgi:hypothetical protein